LQQQAIKFWQAQHERFKQIANGSDSFSLDKTFEEIDRDYPTSGYDIKTDQLLESLGFEKYSQEASQLRSTIALCNKHLRNLKKGEACEIVLWDQGLNETLQEIRFFEREKQLVLSFSFIR